MKKTITSKISNSNKTNKNSNKVTVKTGPTTQRTSTVNTVKGSTRSTEPIKR